jgi:hypothetical protein
MMKKPQLLSVVIIVAVLLVSGTLKAQSVKGNNFLNAGIGIGSFGLSGADLPIALSYEHGFTDEISAGGYFGYAQTKSMSWKFNYYVIGARGSYHFNKALHVANPKLDLYGGLSLFYRGVSVKSTTNNEYFGNVSGGGMDFALHAAARYMFGKHVGGFAELGYGISPLQLGVAFKF